MDKNRITAAVIVALTILNCLAVMRLVNGPRMSVKINSTGTQSAYGGASETGSMSTTESVGADFSNDGMSGSEHLQNDRSWADQSMSDMKDSDIDGPMVVADSDVILIGDTVPVRFYDGSLIYSVADDLKFTCQPKIAEFQIDESGYRNHIVAEPAGKTVITGVKGNASADREFYLLDPGDASNQVSCNTDSIVFTVDTEQNGSGNLELKVDGMASEMLDVRAYTTGDVSVKTSARWEDETLKVSVSNSLSPGSSGMLVIVFTEKNNPQKLVGYKKINIAVVRNYVSDDQM